MTASRLDAWARGVLEQTALQVLQHDADQTFPLADDVMRVDANTYTCPQRFEREKKQIFRRVPLVLAASCELPVPGSYKTLEVAGISVLLTRGRDGQVNALFNSCTHRGATIAQGCGSKARFTCPYHGWTFGPSGALIGIASSPDFGDVDKATLHLKRFPATERAGLIWAILDPDSKADPADMLCGIDRLLDGFGLSTWSFVESRTLPGANWKLAFDAHLEFYHLPVLHRETFGPDRSNRALYFQHGPHQRLFSPKSRPNANPADDILAIGRIPEEIESINPLMMGEWIVFPGVSFNSFHPNGHRGVLMSIVWPGANVGESVTIQTFLSEKVPDAETKSEISKLCDFLGHVVANEDLPTSVGQQKSLATDIIPTILFGRNEGGLQHFHTWIDTLVCANDTELKTLLADPAPAFGS